MPRVFITGLGFITSIGNTAAAVELSLRELRHGLVIHPGFEADNVPVKVIAPVRDFQTDSDDPEDWVIPAPYSIKREQLRSLSPNALYATCAMQQAIADAGLSADDVSNEDTGLYAASAGSPACWRTRSTA
jgi:3-oxoacyl-[acyl-carrier-protein] synthase-1